MSRRKCSGLRGMGHARPSGGGPTPNYSPLYFEKPRTFAGWKGFINDRPYPRQPLWAPCPAWRRGPTQLRYGEHRHGRAGQLQADLQANIVLDCSHANSSKKAGSQPLAMRDCVNQIRLGNRSRVELMIEGFIDAGDQLIPADLSLLRYGCSVTDACVDWGTTGRMIREAQPCCTNR